MPITLPIETRRISQADFGEIAFQVMENVFAIHNEFGRFFNELIYKRELAARMENIALEVPVVVSHGTFSKSYYLDVLVDNSALFEFKSCEAINSKHRGQTLNYLLLADLAHAKIVNVLPERVEHEFVNSSLRRTELPSSAICEEKWNNEISGARLFRETIESLVADWSSVLSLALYQEALCHFLHGVEQVPVRGSSGELGFQTMRMATADIAFKLTSFSKHHEQYAVHARRLLCHTPLSAIFWANMTQNEIQLETICREQ